MHQIIYIMGVSGSGKSTIGRLLSALTGIPFFDADDFHPPENIAKMKSGQPLTDEDRQGWLMALHDLAIQQSRLSGAIIACSALKETYRHLLGSGLTTVHWIFLEGDAQTLQKRMSLRKNHFMPPGLLDSQLKTLEVPVDALCISIELAPEAIVAYICQQLHLQKKSHL